MRRALISSICFCLLLSSMMLSVVASAQGRKAGLWQMATSTTFQKSPLPPALANNPAAASRSLFGGTRTDNVCVTQEQLDKYNAIVAPTQQQDCQLTNVIKTANGMTAEMVCTGRMAGKATIQSSWSDSEHATGTAHFAGTVQMGPNTQQVEWTSSTTSVFKGADCGSIKPIAPPAK